MNCVRNLQINLVILWVTPLDTVHIDLNKIDLPCCKGYKIETFSDFTIKVSSKGFLNIYIKKNILQTLNKIITIIQDFYEFIKVESGVQIKPFTLKIRNIQSSFIHGLTDFKLQNLRERISLNPSLSLTDLREAVHFKIKCRYGIISLLSNRGTLICRDFLKFRKLVKYLKRKIVQ